MSMFDARIRIFTHEWNLKLYLRHQLFPLHVAAVTVDAIGWSAPVYILHGVFPSRGFLRASLGTRNRYGQNKNPGDSAGTTDLHTNRVPSSVKFVTRNSKIHIILSNFLDTKETCVTSNISESAEVIFKSLFCRPSNISILRFGVTDTHYMSLVQTRVSGLQVWLVCSVLTILAFKIHVQILYFF